MKTNSLPLSAEARVEMLPLIDVVFLVLVAFIYASSFLAPKTGLPVDLPEASESKAQRDEVATITIKRNGDLFFNKDLVQSSDLEQVLITAKNDNNSIAIYIKADRRAQLDSLIQVIDITRKVEISNVTIATRHRPGNELSPDIVQ